MRYLILLALCACQVESADNITIYRPHEDPAPVTRSVEGTWINKAGWLNISEDELFCDYAEGKTPLRVTEKYLTLSKKVCNLSYITFYTLFPPYDELFLYANGHKTAHWRL